MGGGLSRRKRAEEESIEGVSSSSIISSEATCVGSSQYDVFLSFRGSDISKAFVNSLYSSLTEARSAPYSMFRDDISTPVGEEVGSLILEAITQSKILIPIISKNYAWNKWCIRKLIHIMDCKKSMPHIVLPIFYKVNPSDVRHLKGRFGRAFHAFKKYFNEKDIQKGLQALKEVSELPGFEIAAGGHEEELVARIVTDVLSKLQQDFQLDVTKHLVGIGGHVNKIGNWANTPANVARMIGIYGMSGIGKTTLAKVLYNQLSNDFVHRSFLANIRETAHRNNIPYLQKQLIKDILQIEREVWNVDHGISLIKSRFKGQKVLILLDDINDKNQLDALAREHNWFKAGSLIIATTRNEAVLDQSEFAVVYKYELNELDKKQALLLFNKHAFRTDHSPRDFESISCDIVSTMGGLPLALQVIGSYLYKKANRKVWEDVWKQLKKQPHRDIQKILLISYDALEDGHKQIFLDIVCFFIGEWSKFAMYMWEDYGFYPSQGVEELKLRCLIKTGDDGTFEMHDQLIDLGRSIFYQGQPLEKCSGPWDYDYKGVPKVLRHNKSPILFDHLMRVASSGDSKELLFEVRWLQWHVVGSDLYLSTTNLHLPKLLVLDLSDSKITELWEGWRLFMASKWLKVLNLYGCRYLRYTPNLSAFTQLKILILNGCFGLEHLHPSIGKLKSLVSLYLIGCKSLKELPKEVGELKDLEELILDDAISIIEIPMSIASLRKLEKLSAINCVSLREIPSSIGELQNLQHLDISRSGIEKLPSAIGRLKNLWALNLISCGSLKGAFPNELGDLPSLEILDIACTSIVELPESIRNLSSLRRLFLAGCDKLLSLPELPSELTYLSISCQSPRLPQLSSLIHLEELHLQACPLLDYIPELSSRLLKLCVKECDKLIVLKLNGLKNLEEFSIKKCRSIERLDLSQLIHLKQLCVEDCNNLVKIQGLDYLEFLEGIFIQECNSLESLLCLESRCLKRLTVVECYNLVEIQGTDCTKFLEALNFTGCKSMETLPDLTGCERLRSLVVQDCTKLTQLRGFEKLDLIDLDIFGCDSLEAIPKLSGTHVHPSIGKLKSLVSLDLSDCGNLKELPEEVGKLEELKELILDSTGIIEIPNWIASMRKLERLSAYFCRSLREVPTSIRGLRNLQDLNLSHSAIEKLPSTIGMLKKLQRLSLQFCYRMKGEILSDIGDLSSLEILDVTSTRISNLPESIYNLSSLQRLSLWGCYELRLLPKLPSSLTNLSVSCQNPTLPQLSCLVHLEELDLYKCVLLEHIPELSSRLWKLCVASCHKLILPKFEVFMYLEELSIKDCSSIERLDLSILNRLKRLHVEDCYNLVEIQSHNNLDFLEEIVIDCCKSIGRLILPKLQCLKQLKANYCDNLVEIQGLGKAEFLQVLDISYCESIETLPDLSFSVNLKELNINGCCNLRDIESLKRFLFCRSIYITGCQSLEKLPNLSKFGNLENFTMRYSLGVTEMPGVEESRSLTHIDITGCKSMEILPDLSGCDKLQSLVVQDCKKLTRLQGLQKLDLIYLDISGCDSLETIPKLLETRIFRNYERAQDEVPDGNIILQ